MPTFFALNPNIGLTAYLITISVLLLCVWRILRRPQASVGQFFGSMMLYAIVAILASILYRADGFHVLTLCAWGCFGGGLIGLLIAAWYSRKRHFKVLFVFYCILAVAITLIGIDAFIVEPHWLEVREVHLRSPKLHSPLVIGVLSDLQTDHVGDYERNVLETLMKAKPDLIVLPGDYIQVDPPERAVQIKALNSLLAQLKVSAPLGAYAVQGNCEDSQWPEIFAQLPIKTFVATGDAHPRSDVDVYGLSFNDSFNPHLKLVAKDPLKYSIVFGHGPDYSLGDVHADLLVAGHTHGGQVQLPSFGPLIILSNVARAVGAGGLFQTNGDSKLLLTRGAGMERFNAPRLRFLCRPEIVIVRVDPATSDLPGGYR